MKIMRFLLLILLLQSQNAFALGKLFMTPDQRIQLEQKKTVNQDQQSQKVDKSKLKVPQSIYLNGFVKPKHAASTIWVNGQLRSARPQRNYYVRHWVSPENQVSVDLQGGRAELSPGQTLDIDNSVVKEVYHLNTQENEQKQKDLQEGTVENEKPSVMQQAMDINEILTDFPE